MYLGFSIFRIPRAIVLLLMFRHNGLQLNSVFTKNNILKLIVAMFFSVYVSLIFTMAGTHLIGGLNNMCVLKNVNVTTVSDTYFLQPEQSCKVNLNKNNSLNNICPNKYECKDTRKFGLERYHSLFENGLSGYLIY